MGTKIDITCPVSPDRVDENVARTVAVYVIVLTVISLALNNYIIALLLAADFALRAFTKGDYSTLKFIGKRTAKFIGLSPKPTDAAPKKFAAGLGFTFTLLIGILQISQQYIAADVVGGILLFCAVLEGGLGICLGCIVYSALIVPFKQKATA